MARETNKLTPAAIKAVKANGSIQKLADGQGLFLAIFPNDSRCWRLKYRFGGVEKALGKV